MAAEQNIQPRNSNLNSQNLPVYAAALVAEALCEAALVAAALALAALAEDADDRLAYAAAVEGLAREA
jgi:hypothetical protein